MRDTGSGGGGRGVKPDTHYDRTVQQQRSILLHYGGLGMELAGGILAFVAVGYWVDWKFKTGPIGVIVGSVIGCVGGLYHVVRRAIQMQREFTSADSDASDGGNLGNRTSHGRPTDPQPGAAAPDHPFDDAGRGDAVRLRRDDADGK